MTATPVDPPVARAVVAECWLAPRDGNGAGMGTGNAHQETGLIAGDECQLGRVSLRPHQLDAVRELRAMIGDTGGALLADETGLGKTFVALALARDARRPLVIAPAALRSMWVQAALQAAVRIATCSTESLSRDGLSAPPAPSPDLVIVDEAHHFRNPKTRRYRALRRITAGSRVLLLSATPVHNRSADLGALLALFQGARATTMTDAERARCIVRRGHESLRTRGRSDADGASPLRVPLVDGPHRLALPDDGGTLEALTALPAPVPPRNAGVSGALVAFGLLHQWASSAGALRAALRRRVGRALALASALEAGRYPSYREVRAWCVGEGAVQLAFPELLVSESPDAGALLAAVRRHEAAVRALLDQLTSAPDPDVVRAERVREVARTHAGLRVVAFTAYEDTVRALYRQLRGGGRVCALSAAGGVIASGRISRAEAIAQFAPDACRSGRGATPESSRIDLLLTTDLMSEGVNLQAAGAVIHLDLPWTPARLEQRVGRLARLGSLHERVFVYALAPPASADALLGIEGRLRSKLEIAGRAVGVVGSILPPLIGHGAGGTAARAGPAEHAADARALVNRWLAGRSASAGDPRGGAKSTVCAAVRADAPGFLAACVASGRPMLVAAGGAGVTDAPDAVAQAVRSAEGDAVPVDVQLCGAAMVAIAEWWGQQRAAEDAGLHVAAGANERRRVLTRIASIARRAPPHLRPRLAPLIGRARSAATISCGAGAEWVLGELANAPLPDVAWLRAVGAFGDSYGARATPADGPGAGGRHSTGSATAELTVSAVILLVPAPVTGPAPASGTASAGGQAPRDQGAGGSVFQTAIPPACGPTSIDATFCRARRSMTSTVPGCEPMPSSETNA